MPSGLRAMIMAASRVDFAHHRQSGASILESRRRLTPVTHVLNELRHLRRPRVVWHRVLPDGGFRRTHLGEHSIPGQSLDSVAASEAIHLELAVAADELPAEGILPL